MWTPTPEELYGGAFALFLVWALVAKGDLGKLTLGAGLLFFAVVAWAWREGLPAPFDKPDWFP